MRLIGHYKIDHQLIMLIYNKYKFDAAILRVSRVWNLEIVKLGVDISILNTLKPYRVTFSRS